MTYLTKPRWIESEDEDRPFAVPLTPTREEMDNAEPVQFPGEDEYAERSADLYHLLDDFDTTEDRVMVAEPNPLLDEPEWGGRRDQPEIKSKKASVQIVLEADEEPDCCDE
jgi:hypothetical protein